MNDCLLGKIEAIAGRSILELGAGNGYFAPILLRRFSGQRPARLVISDQSQAQLDSAQAAFILHDAEYAQIDVRQPFPFAGVSFDLILAIMLLNELTNAGLRAALTDFGHDLFVMPSAEGLRLPVSRRSEQMYLDTMSANGFAVVAEPVSADAKTLHAKPGLKLPHDTPLALVLNCSAADAYPAAVPLPNVTSER